ncbi:hypothetical protein EMMF5_000123 [Cystobasidiomycetes sp. EMM_F5]
MSDTTDPTGGDPSAADLGGCNDGSPYNGSFGLRVGGIFIILVTSMAGTLFPIISKRVRRLAVPKLVFEFAKYFGAGV